MNVVDSSAWLSYFAGDKNAEGMKMLRCRELHIWNKERWWH